MTSSMTFGRVPAWLAALTVAFVLLSPFAFARPAAAQGNFGLETAIGGIKEENRPATFTNQSGKTDIPVLIGRIISIALSLVGTLFLLLTLYGGFLWMSARGDAKTVDNAKKILGGAAIGLIIVAGAYAFTTFVLTALNEEKAAEAPAAAPTAPSGATIGEACTVDADCAQGLVCSDVFGDCTGGAVCLNDAQCPAGETCTPPAIPRKCGA